MKPLKYTIIYSILSSNQRLWVALGDTFEALLEVKRPSEVVLGACSFKSAFFEDVSNEITTFAVPRGPKTGPNSLRRCLAVAQTLFETALTLRITFCIA